jgi:phosphoglycerol transferase MdoB-like AlkP superfamily enzyme
VAFLFNLTNMAGRIKFLFLYLLTWVFFFQLARIIFLVSESVQTKLLPAHTIVSSFLYGLRMDLSMSSYLLVPVCLFILLSVFIPFFRSPFIYKIYSGILLFIFLLIIIADLEVFREWGFRIDSTPLKYLASPREAWASVSHLPVVFYLVFFVLVFAIFYFAFAKWLNYLSLYLTRPRYKLSTSLLTVIFAGLLIIPIRGGVQLTPMNQSIVYFSTSNFANQAAINAPWNLMYSLISENSSTKNPYHYMPVNSARQIRDSLFQSIQKNTQVLKTRTPNIILIVWESFTEKATHLSINGKEVTPNFNRLKKEGIYFSHAYASGDRTDKGLAAVLGAYPALPKTSVIRLPAKTRKLETLGALYKKQGYKTAFYYGGETEFANIKSFLLQNEFNPIIDKSAFSQKDLNSKWGAHDGVVASRILNDLGKTSQPFFFTWLTLSSHEPFETPVATTFKGSDHTTLFLNSLHYTDSILFHFVEECKKLPSWNNTLLVVVADHGHPLPETGRKLDNFKIPIIWLGGALKEQGISYDRVCSQLDIAATITHQTIGAENYFPFSKNLFDSTSKNWAFFTFNDGFGFVNPVQTVLYDNVGKRILYTSGNIDSTAIKAGKALQQFSFQDYVDK